MENIKHIPKLKKFIKFAKGAEYASDEQAKEDANKAVSNSLEITEKADALEKLEENT